MTSPTPGWYSDPDPTNAGGQRFWDGAQWTDQATPGASASTPPPTAPGSGGDSLIRDQCDGLIRDPPGLRRGVVTA
ncbi:DUF2510 domain-containing protein [Rhodococcus sp. KRD197]|uniref:DUF2510 domain-containing protein n=1 Tax=Rhodococcus sp. KRD197 TaxID=2729731 RepID=UPI001F4950C8|nr:DUF2510 domain-containing protein [Rhodococcus sp. KRD197]